MTINKAIERLDAVKPSAYGDGEKAGWIAALDGMISLEVMHMEEAVTYDYPEDGDKPLLVAEPYDGIYELYLGAKVDFYNREYGSYNNSMTVFSSLFEDFKKQYIRTNMPPGAEGFRNVV